MSDQPPGKPSGDPSQPFTRGRIQWGRPPQTLFRFGPLPTGQVQSQGAPRPAPAAAPRQDFFSSSMIPQKPVEAPVEIETAFEPLEPVVTPTPQPLPPVEAEIEPVAAVEAEDSYDGDEDAFEPEPSVAAEPVYRRDEIVVEAEEPDDLVTQPPLSGAARPDADPKAMPSVVVTPTLYARMGTAIETVAKPKNRWVIFAGIAALVVTGAFIWIATLPAGEAGAPLLDPDAPPPAAPGAVEAAPVETTPEAVEAEPAAAPVARAATPVAPTTTARVAPARRPAEATPPPVATTETPAPEIQTQTLNQTPPTPAEPAPADPSAPIETRPQPLN